MRRRTVFKKITYTLYSHMEPKTVEEELAILKKAQAIPKTDTVSNPTNLGLRLLKKIQSFLPEGVPMLKIHNLVARFRLGIEPGYEGLVYLATRLRNTEFNPPGLDEVKGGNKGFPAAIFRHIPPLDHIKKMLAKGRKPHSKTTFSVFASGYVLMNGGLKTESAARRAALFFSNLLRRIGGPFKGSKIELLGVCNVHGAVTLPFGVNLERVCGYTAQAQIDYLTKVEGAEPDKLAPDESNYFWSEYNPEIFPGLRIKSRIWEDDPLEDHHHPETAQARHTKRKGISATIYVNGKMFITGAKREIQLYLFYLRLIPILKHFSIDKKLLPAARRAPKKRKS